MTRSGNFDSNVNVAVIISTYSRDKAIYLYYALKSIFDQTYSKLHIYLMVDGAISDDCRRVIDIFLAKDRRISVRESTTSKGLSVGLNVLIDEILKCKTYNYIARMDADDICRLDRFSLQLSFMEDNKDVDVLGTACIEFGRSNKLITKYEQHEEIVSNFIPIVPFIHPSVIFRIRVFEYGIRYPTEYHLTEDLALWTLLIRKKFKLHNLREGLLYYRMNKGTIKRRSNYKKAYNEMLVRLRYIIEVKDRRATFKFFLTFFIFLIKLLPPFILSYLYRILR